MHFIAREELILKPGQQRVLAVTHSKDDFEGLSQRTGLVTPSRDLAAMSNKFGVAYVYGDSMTKVLIMNVSTTEVTIRRGAKVAEFHPRPDSDMFMFSTDMGIPPGREHTKDDSKAGTEKTCGAGMQTLTPQFEKSPDTQGASCGLNEVGRDRLTCERTCGIDSEVRLSQQEEEKCTSISCVAQPDSADSTTSTTAVPRPEEKPKDGPISMTADQVTDEMVAAEWLKEPLSQVDLSQLRMEQPAEVIRKRMRTMWELSTYCRTDIWISRK